MVINFISLALLQGVNYLLLLLSFPFLLRAPGVERWGLVTFGYALIRYFIMFTDFGFSLSATKYISGHKMDLGKINSYLNNTMPGHFFLCGVSFAILLILITCLDKFKSESSFCLLYFSMIIDDIVFPMWFLQGMENTKYVTVFNIVAKSLSFLPFFIFIRKPENYIYVSICYSFGFILAGIVSIFIVCFRMEMKWYFTSIEEVSNSLKDSSTYFLSRASTSSLTTSNSFLLDLICGNTAVGHYSAAEKLYQAHNQLLTPFTGVSLPHIAKSRDVLFFKKVFHRITFSNFFCVTTVLSFSSYVLRFVYGTADPDILEAFRILAIACLVTIPSMLLGYPFPVAMGHPLYASYTVVTTSMVHTTGLATLYVCGMIAPITVAMMVVMSEILLFLFRIWGTRRFGLFRA